MNHPILSILLEGENTGGGLSGMIMIIAMIAIFYFFMIRPNQKKQKEIKQARDSMQKGDKIVTAGGIHGKINEVTEKTVIIEVAPGVTLKVDKQSVFPAVADDNAKRERRPEETNKRKEKNQKAEVVSEEGINLKK